MSSHDWRELSANAFKAEKFLCVGLDPIMEKVPERFRRNSNGFALSPAGILKAFTIERIDQVAANAGFFKPNWAFFLRYGAEGLSVLKQVIKYIHRTYPHIPVILDCKVGDIGATNSAYADCLFGELGADAITAHAYLGREAMMPFLKHADKGVILLCHTSNPGAGEFQELSTDGKKLFLQVASHVHNSWNTNGNCGLVAGATFADQIIPIRGEFQSGPILIPGIGTQGGDLKASVKAGMTRAGEIIMNSASAIIFSENPEQAAQEHDRDIRSAFNS